MNDFEKFKELKPFIDHGLDRSKGHVELDIYRGRINGTMQGNAMGLLMAAGELVKSIVKHSDSSTKEVVRALDQYLALTHAESLQVQ